MLISARKEGQWLEMTYVASGDTIGYGPATSGHATLGRSIWCSMTPPTISISSAPERAARAPEAVVTGRFHNPGTPVDKHPASGTRRKPRTPLTQEQQGLARSYIPFAKKIAAPLRDCWPSNAEEFDSAAVTALVQAAQSFDPSRGVKFATFARYRIWGALKDMQRGMNLKGF